MFKFELISPEEKLISEDVTMVTVPGSEGEFGVLEGHSPLLAAVKAGVVRIAKNDMNDHNPRRVFVAGGFADVGPDHCTLLAEEAHDLALVDVTVLDAEIDSLASSLASSPEEERRRNEVRLAMLQAKREAL
jgi:F-type H+-transporting ATPase subunit epsilon